MNYFRYKEERINEISSFAYPIKKFKFFFTPVLKFYLIKVMIFVPKKLEVRLRNCSDNAGYLSNPKNTDFPLSISTNQSFSMALFTIAIVFSVTS